MLVGFIVSAILVAVVWRVVRSGVDLAKGDSDTAFRWALKVFVLLSFVTGAMVFGAVYEHGLHRGLRGFYEAICAAFGVLGLLCMANCNSGIAYSFKNRALRSGTIRKPARQGGRPTGCSQLRMGP